MENIFDNSIMQNLISEQIKKIQSEKDRLIKERLFNLLGYEVDLLKESQMIFPRICIRIDHDRTERVYWNSSVEYPTLLITFYYKVEFSVHDHENKFFTGFSYH